MGPDVSTGTGETGESSARQLREGLFGLRGPGSDWWREHSSLAGNRRCRLFGRKILRWSAWLCGGAKSPNARVLMAMQRRASVMNLSQSVVRRGSRSGIAVTLLDRLLPSLLQIALPVTINARFGECAPQN